MKYVSVLFSILSRFLLHGSVLGVDPFEGGTPRFQCIKEVRIPINSCTKNFMDAYNETETAKEDKNINDPDTYIFLFTRRNKDRAEYLHKCPGRVPENTHFQPDKKTVIIVHGFLEDTCEILWMREMKDQFLCRDDYNVILIDWGWGDKLDYGSAVKSTEVVGKQIAFLIRGIRNQTRASPDKFHIVGHSLGGQVAGYAGACMQGDEKIGRITVFGFGYPDPVGHADFYPNGGSIQLSCIIRNIGSFLKGDLFHATTALIPILCYHQQSVHYFIASINPCGCQFIGVKSDDYESSKNIRSCDGGKCAVMGLDWVDYGVETDRRPNKYNLDTTLICPYCVDTGLKIKRNSSLEYKKHCYRT